MTKLSSLRSRLADLRRRRQAVRWGTGYSGAILAVFWVLLAAFLIDLKFELNKPERVLLLLVCLGVVAWAVRRFTLPWLGQRESDLDMALMVERQQKIDSDLVAALQFESPEAARWGSTQLETAVIDYVAEFGRGWNLLEGVSRETLVRRAGALTATVLLLGIAVAMYPNYARVFLNRMLLGSAHYPTNTEIQEILVNGVSIDPEDPTSLKVAYGRPLKFEIRCAGELPAQGKVELKTVNSGLATDIDLVRKQGNNSIYVGELPKMVDSLNYELYLGDAWTDPAELTVIALPVVETKLLPKLPSYARAGDLTPEAGDSARQISVIEGSEVGLEVACSNKRLSNATLLIEKKSYPLKEARSADSPGRNWMLSTGGTPLARVERPLRYEIQVTDEDGLQLEHPIQGFIRIKADQRPRVSADVVTRFVLPTASPQIEYRANDDFGISKLVVHLQVAGSDGASRELDPISIPLDKKPTLRDDLPLKKMYRLAIKPLKLVKGDDLKVTLEAVDLRGDAPGQSAMSEPVVLHVTDESGVLAAISESDERSARQLDAIIKRQLGIGESK